MQIIPENEENNNNVSDTIASGISVNAALMRLVQAYGGTVQPSDTNAQLIDKLVTLSGGGKVLVVHILTDENDKKYMDKPAGQIYDVLENGVVSVIEDDGSGAKGPVLVNAYAYYEDTHTYMFDIAGAYDSPFFAHSESEYPAVIANKT